MAKSIYNKKMLPNELYASPFQEAEQSRLKIFEIFISICLLGCFLFIASYILNQKYNLIPFLLYPFIIPLSGLLFVLRKYKLYKINILGIFYFYSLMGYMKLYCDPTYLVDFFLLPAFIGFSFLALKKNHALISILYLILFYLSSSLIVIYYRPFEIAYTNSNTGSLYVGYLLSFSSITVIFYTFSKHYQNLISRLDSAMKSLHATNQNNKLMINVVTHDISNYLTATNFMIYGLKEEFKNEDITLGLKKLESTMNNLTDLVRNVQLVRDLSIGSKEHLLKEVNVFDVTKKIELVFQQKMKEKELQFELSLGYESTNLFTEPNIFIHNILANILSNAIKFSPEGNFIQINLEQSPSHHILQMINVAEAKHLPNLNKIQTGLNVSTLPGTKEEKGQGLGLSIVQQFCQMLNITYSIETKEKDPHFIQVVNTLCIPKKSY